MLDNVNLRIGLIADDHNEHNGLMRRAVASMCKKKPLDYLFHLGDFLHNFDGRPGSNPYSPYKTAARRLSEIADEFDLGGIGIIPGNHEIRHPESGLCELEDLSIHGDVVTLGSCNFLGYGGGFNFVKVRGWDAFSDVRYECDAGELSSLLEGKNVDVLLLHQLETRSGRKSLRKVIDDLGVKIVVSGHTHSHGVEFYGKTMYASCGPIWPLDERTHSFKNMGKSSYGVLEIKNNIARIKLYFFGRNRQSDGDTKVLDTEMKINFNHY